MFRHEQFDIKINSTFRKKCIEWVKTFNTFCVLDSNSHVLIPQKLDFHDHDLILAVGVNQEVSSETANSISEIDKAFNRNPNWYFGFFSYDLKNSIENLSSKNEDHLNWPDFYFFIPRYLVILKGRQIIIQTNDSDSKTSKDILSEIQNTTLTRKPPIDQPGIKPRISKEEYIQNVEEIKKHIHRGDIYEVNYCQEFFSNTEIDPFDSFLRLNTISPTPFSCFFRLKDKYLISASPERFIKKRDLKIISQPIKGTIKRGLTVDEDNDLKKELLSNPKEKAENVMIVDLVRNDLSKVAARKTIKVDELCGLYSFSQVHQLISTISAITTTNSIEKIISATFPMGSMTGAPKIKAMELAEKYETSKRGLYSGSVGYISPNKDFDFNVVIRSLQYNHANKYLSYMVGGAITSLSDAEKEYEECMLKASAIKQLLKV